MGLLDDAIREHLELKRRRGADPGEVAREQREALDVPPGDAQAAPDPAAALAGEASPGAQVGAAFSEDALDSQPTDDAHGSDVRQETEELDMRSVLDEDRDVPGADELSAGRALAAPTVGASREDQGGEDSLEFEAPVDALGEPAVAGESVEYALGVPGAADGDPQADDVLEEAPDLLRDTPEQERPSFEQPPRDFDLDK
jgi:hypothetical protein